MKINTKMTLANLFLFIFLIYVLICIFLFFNQRNLMYHPDENNYSGDNLEVGIEKVSIQTTDNIKLLGWFHNKNLKNYKTIVYFHGNAGTLENRIHKLNHFKDMDVNFLIIAWRGFSGNKGKPTEEGLYTDGISAINWLKEKEHAAIIEFCKNIGVDCKISSHWEKGGLGAADLAEEVAKISV